TLELVPVDVKFIEFCTELNSYVEPVNIEFCKFIKLVYDDSPNVFPITLIKVVCVTLDNILGRRNIPLMKLFATLFAPRVNVEEPKVVFCVELSKLLIIDVDAIHTDCNEFCILHELPEI